MHVSFREEIFFALEKIKTNIRAASELRASFALQILGMMLNNISFVVVWIFFFKAFGKVNGWTGIDVIGLQGILSLVFGITEAFTGGIFRLPETVNNGNFDSTLLSPRSLYFAILTNSTRISALGDIFFGVLMVIYYVVVIKFSFAQIGILISLLFPATAIIMNVSLTTSLISFVFTDSEKLSRNMFEAFFSPALYPSGLFHGALRTIFIFIIPSLPIAGLPIDIVKHFNIVQYVVVWSIAFLWFFLVQFLLKKAVRRYESGNLTGARV